LLHTTDLGLVAERVELSAHSHWNGRLLGETRTDGVASTTAAASAKPLSHVATPSSAPLISASRCSGPSGG
ncbi:hypothetical protein AB0428_33470, partial [Streptomyces virginiae]